MLAVRPTENSVALAFPLGFEPEANPKSYEPLAGWALRLGCRLAIGSKIGEVHDLTGAFRQGVETIKFFLDARCSLDLCCRGTLPGFRREGCK